MSRKTKRQKISSELRRKLKSTSQKNLSASKSIHNLVKRQNDSMKNSCNPASTYAYVYEKRPVTKPKTEVLSANYTYVVHDLIKITIFTAIALTFQGVLYFLLYKG